MTGVSTASKPVAPDAGAADARRVRQAEAVISTLLRAGVLVSVALIVVGVFVTLVHHPGYLTSSADLAALRSGSAPFPTTVSAVLTGLAHAQGRAIIAAGLLTLVATPVLRVAISIGIFGFARDRTFTLITTAVLALLLLSLLLGKAGG